LDRPLSELLDEIQVSSTVRAALVDHTGVFYQILKLAIALERGLWEQLSPLTQELKLDEQLCSEIYLRALKWSQQTYKP
jgi:EAL and modified HD-GYP domain-containing signal transduction protein